jgi:hypothetical protein
MPNLKKVKAYGTQKGGLSAQIPFCQLPGIENPTKKKIFLHISPSKRKNIFSLHNPLKLLHNFVIRPGKNFFISRQKIFLPPL